MKKMAIISFICIILDQIVKLIIIDNIALNKGIKIIEDFFYLTYVRNYGAAWSILSGSRVFLIIVAIISLILIYFFLIKNTKLSKFNILCFGLLYGGIIGNLIDRVVRGYVVDYLEFIIINYNFPIFNIADSLIVISIFLIIIGILKEEKNGLSSKWIRTRTKNWPISNE